MAHIISARVYETSVTSGTGPLTLAGAINGHVRANDVMTIGDTGDYLIAAGGSFEEGFGTYSGTHTLTRTQVRRSTNGNAAVNWGTETKFVSIVVHGARQNSVFGHLPRGKLSGMGLSVSGNTVTIATGHAAADAAPYDIMLRTATITKSTSAWSAGNGGGLDTGSASINTWYAIHVIGKLDGTVDAVLSLSATSPTMPSGYVWKRYIGSVRTDGSGNFLAFQQFGDRFTWNTPVVDANALTVGTTQQLIALTVPPLTGVVARMRCTGSNAAATASILLSETTETPTATGVGLQSIIATTAGNSGHYELAVNSSRQIKAVSNHASTILSIGTNGWFDRRGRED
jgi:hypothetical protein